MRHSLLATLTVLLLNSVLLGDEPTRNRALFSAKPIWTSGSRSSGGDGNARWIDADKDGDPDLVTSVPNPRRWALFKNEDGKLASKPAWESKETTDCDHISVLDFNGDGWPDLAATHESHCTINDLATAGAEPLGLSLGVILEEGFPVSDLRRIVDSIHDAARAAGTSIVTGDTKVVHRGKADKIFINTAGVGIVRCDPAPSISRPRPGDRVLLSGSIGEHGMTVLAARGELELELETRSDTAALNGLVKSILDAVQDSTNEGTSAVRCLKDPTRGGVATALNEIAAQSQVGVTIDETTILVRPEVQGACEILGIDPLYVANEGKLLVVTAPEYSDRVLNAMRRHEFGNDTRIIGQVTDEPKGLVLLQTAIGGTRVVDMLVGDALPRIC